MAEQQPGRRPNLDLEKIGLRPGDILTLVNDADVSCMVVRPSPPQVVYDGHTTSLTSACNQAYGVNWNDPAAVWVFEGETLSERRQRFQDYHRQQ